MKPDVPVKLFKVQAWEKSTKVGEEDRRFPHASEKIYAPDGLTAAFMYAHTSGIHCDDWYNAGPTPTVVIRVEEVS